MAYFNKDYAIDWLLEQAARFEEAGNRNRVPVDSESGPRGVAKRYLEIALNVEKMQDGPARNYLIIQGFSRLTDFAMIQD